MPPVEIGRLRVPDAVGSDGWPEFVAFAEQVNAIQREVEGEHALRRSPEQALVAQQHQAYLEKPVWVARDGDQVVGSARGRRPLDDGAAAMFAQIAVTSVHRRQGVGTELLDRVVEHARHRGCITLQSFVVHPSDSLAPLVPAASGSGGVPATNPETRFLIQHGFTLEQASLGSTLALPVDPDHLNQVEAQARRRSSGYEVVTWSAPTDTHLLDDLALLRRRMSTDAPSAGRDADEEHWDAARTRQHDAMQVAAGRAVLYAGAIHRASGHLVAFTELWLEADPHVVPDQLDTLVLREHRGHGLGVLVKVANLRRLAAVRPGSSLIKTFNASENEHMVAINRRLGFVPWIVSGAWQKRLPG
ncbi:MAG: GNAT family N-acetyltransferase [Terracoccus sp.]